MTALVLSDGGRPTDSEDWISAAEALKLVAATTGAYAAKMAICTRAHAGMIEARAARLTIGTEAADDVLIPKEFWWADGHEALTQNWKTGDFETWIEHRHEVKAFGVSFARRGVEALAGPGASQPAAAPKALTASGRPPAEWWDDLWVEMCRQLYEGELQPKRQADVELAMAAWASAHGYSASESTFRSRARKLWTSLKVRATG